MRTSIFHRVLCSTFVFVGFVFVGMLPTSYAINISVQYPSGPLFYSGIDNTAKAAINAAAADVSAAITTSLNAITNDVVVGSSGSTTATFNMSFFYTDPSSGAQVDIASATSGADEVIVFVGVRNIFGSESLNKTLGTGGAGGTLANITGASGPTSGWVGAVADAISQAETRYARGGGPIIGTSTGGSTYGTVSAAYDLDYGLTVGNLWFDVDSDNNGSTDSNSLLNNYWHWNHTTSVVSGKNDLYSTALHEILHAVGIGSSSSWNDLASGTTWNGSEVLAITGSGNSLVDGEGNHIAKDVMSTRISDGSPQEVVMDPDIVTGTRKELTVLDLAFLRDIGYETIVPSTPSADYDGNGFTDAADLARLENWYGINDNGDADGDGDTDGADFLAWQQQYTGPPPTSSTVPEPTSASLLVPTLIAVGCRRRLRSF